MTSISALGLQLQLINSLSGEQNQLASLNEQLASGDQYSNLTNYDPTQAKQLLDFQNGITQRQSYLSSINTVQSRLTLYNSTMSDMETIAQQASTLASQNQNFNSATASQVQASAQNYLLQAADDLNQQIGGRYIYAGSRYGTQPVSTSSSVLNGAPQSIITDQSALPSYDSQATATTSVNYGATLPGSSATVGYASSTTTAQVYDASGTAHTLDYKWTKTGSNSWNLTLTAPDATYTATVPFTFDASTDSLSAIGAGSNYTVATPTTAGAAASVDVSLTFSDETNPQSISLNFGDYGQTSGATAVLVDNAASTVTQTSSSPSAANSYAADSVVVDSNFNVTYGVSSNDPSFQKLINGLRYMNAAVTAGNAGNTATYQSDMTQATTMLADALNGIQTLNAGVAGNQNTLTQETTVQNNNIATLQDQLGSIQNVDIAQVSTEITALQTQLEASYSATGNIEKLSLVNYL